MILPVASTYHIQSINGIYRAFLSFRKNLGFVQSFPMENLLLILLEIDENIEANPRNGGNPQSSPEVSIFKFSTCWMIWGYSYRNPQNIGFMELGKIIWNIYVNLVSLEKNLGHLLTWLSNMHILIPEFIRCCRFISRNRNSQWLIFPLDSLWIITTSWWAQSVSVDSLGYI